MNTNKLKLYCVWTFDDTGNENVFFKVANNKAEVRSTMQQPLDDFCKNGFKQYTIKLVNNVDGHKIQIQ